MTVYFAHGAGLIKIGQSTDVPRRMRSLGTDLLATMPGGFAAERAIHGWFASDHIGNEWFRPSPALMAHIETMPPECVVKPVRTYLTSADVARLFDVSIPTVTRWAKSGRLPATRTPGGSYRFKPGDVEAALDHPAAEAVEVA